MGNFKEWVIKEGSLGLSKQLRQRFGDMPSNSQMTQGQRKDDLWQAYQRAQKINKDSGGLATVYHAVGGVRGLDRFNPKETLIKTLSWLTSHKNQEISVSVNHKLNSPIVVEGKGKLIYYYPMDAMTTSTSLWQKVPDPIPDRMQTKYDEGVINLRDVTWTKLHVNDPKLIMGIDAIANQFQLQLVNPY